MKIKKIASGYYSWEYSGLKGTISKLEDGGAWYFQIGSSPSHDWYSTFRITKIAVVEYVDCLKKNI